MSGQGRFIVFEGVDGSGKSTCIARLGRLLRERSRSFETLREPGTSPLGEQLRQLLKHGGPDLISDNKTEALLFYAARAENLHQIKDWLGQGVWVIADRFNDSTFAYQSYDGSISIEEIARLDRLCLGDFSPDLVLLLDIDAEQIAARLKSRERDSRSQEPDRFHMKGEDHNRHLIDVYRRRADLCADNHIVVDGRGDPGSVAERALDEISSRFLNDG